MSCRKQALAMIAIAGMSASIWASEMFLEDCGRTAETFAFVADASGSMMQTVGHMKSQVQNEIEDARKRGESLPKIRLLPPANEEIDKLTRLELTQRFIEKTGIYAIEKAGMKSSVLTVAPFTQLVPMKERSSEEFKTDLQKKFGVRLEVFGRSTWVGSRAFESFSEKLAKSQATVLVTDGSFEVDPDKKHLDPVATLKAFYEANPKSCIHIVSAAYTEKERKAIDELASVPTCGRIDDLEALMTDEALWKSFVEEVFYRECQKAATIEIQGINFAFDKSNLPEESRRILDKALAVINSRDKSERIEIRGWTDWTGSDKYNAGLSQRRANAVRNYFIEHGVDADRLTARGMGKSFKYTNKTNDGRWMNRRVELIFEGGLQSNDSEKRYDTDSLN